jgi:hypothetical protein
MVTVPTNKSAHAYAHHNPKLRHIAAAAATVADKPAAAAAAADDEKKADPLRRLTQRASLIGSAAARRRSSMAVPQTAMPVGKSDDEGLLTRGDSVQDRAGPADAISTRSASAEGAATPLLLAGGRLRSRRATVSLSDAPMPPSSLPSLLEGMASAQPPPPQQQHAELTRRGTSRMVPILPQVGEEDQFSVDATSLAQSASHGLAPARQPEMASSPPSVSDSHSVTATEALAAAAPSAEAAPADALSDAHVSRNVETEVIGMMAQEPETPHPLALNSRKGSGGSISRPSMFSRRATGAAGALLAREQSFSQRARLGITDELILPSFTEEEHEADDHAVAVPVDPPEGEMVIAMLHAGQVGPSP